MPRQFPMNQRSQQQLEEKLRHFRQQRAEVAELLRIAIQQGDLSENSDYTEAKHQQSIIEGKIAELEVMLANAVIVDPSCNAQECVGLYSWVKVLDLDYEEEIEYTLVPGVEADFQAGKISFESPLGRGLMGKGAGDEVEIETPGGLTRLRVLEVRSADT
ncbi:MAG: transcription elongation factor GreA [Candidatus Zipacnadales bacterium]